MSSVLEKLGDSVADAIMPGKPSRAKKRQYRESVLAGGEPPENVVMPVWMRDRVTVEAADANVLRAEIELPALERAASEVAQAAEAARRLATEPLPRTMPLDDLWQPLVAAGYRGTCKTLDDLAAALPFSRANVHTLRTAAFKAAETVRNCRMEILETLRRTTVNLPPDREVQRLSGEIESIKHRINCRREVVDSERKIAAVRGECERLASGQRPPDYSSVHAPGEQPTPLSQLYKAAKKRLDSLVKLAAGKASAEEANRADEAELQQLSEQLAVAQRESLVRQTKSAKQHLRWVGDDES